MSIFAELRWALHLLLLLASRTKSNPEQDSIQAQLKDQNSKWAKLSTAPNIICLRMNAAHLVGTRMRTVHVPYAVQALIQSIDQSAEVSITMIDGSAVRTDAITSCVVVYLLPHWNQNKRGSRLESSLLISCYHQLSSYLVPLIDLNLFAVYDQTMAGILKNNRLRGYSQAALNSAVISHQNGGTKVFCV